MKKNIIEKESLSIVIFSCVNWASVSSPISTLEDLHEKLCPPEVARVLHFLWSRVRK